MAYVYRFLDVSDKIIYVGYTGRELSSRINEHFEKGHLDQSCYDRIAVIEYKKYKTNADAMIMENYYINMFKPFYNKLNKVSGEISITIDDEQNWKVYKKLRPKISDIQTREYPYWKIFIYNTVMFLVVVYTIIYLIVNLIL